MQEVTYIRINEAGSSKSAIAIQSNCLEMV
jgi:hypothetical protein